MVPLPALVTVLGIGTKEIHNKIKQLSRVNFDFARNDNFSGVLKNVLFTKVCSPRPAFLGFNPGGRRVKAFAPGLTLRAISCRLMSGWEWNKKRVSLRIFRRSTAVCHGCSSLQVPLHGVVF